MTVIVNEQLLQKIEARQPVKVTVVCPRCKNNFCQRIPRGSVVKLALAWLPLKHFRCDRCLKNFYKVD